jgi:hypothetical protein
MRCRRGTAPAESVDSQTGAVLRSCRRTERWHGNTPGAWTVNQGSGNVLTAETLIGFVVDVSYGGFMNSFSACCPASERQRTSGKGLRGHGINVQIGTGRVELQATRSGKTGQAVSQRLAEGRQ